MTITGLLILLLPLAGTSLGAFTVFFMKDKVDSKVERMLLGFAAGVMTAAAVWSLLIPAIGMNEGMFSWVPALVGFLLGIAFLIGIDFIVPRLLDGSSRGTTDHKVLSADEAAARAEKNRLTNSAKNQSGLTAPKNGKAARHPKTLHKNGSSKDKAALHEAAGSKETDTLHETDTPENTGTFLEIDSSENTGTFHETDRRESTGAIHANDVTKGTAANDRGALNTKKSGGNARPRSNKASSQNRSRNGFSKTFMLLLAVTIHNIPEGMAVGVALVGALSGNVGITAAGALALSLGIAIQNFPEGAIISLPLKGGGMSKGRSFLCGVLSGVVEPIGGVITLLLASQIKAALPYLLSFAAGAMFYVVFEELIPEYREDSQPYLGTIGAAAGFALMMALDVALG